VPGHHNSEVLETLLGLSPDAVAQLHDDGVV
jgi:formyl-CoA transferase